MGDVDRVGGMPLDPGTAALLELIAAAGYPPMHEGTPELARKAFRAMTVDTVTPETQVPVGSVEDVEVAGFRRGCTARSATGRSRRWSSCTAAGFVIGDLDTHDQTCRRFCSGAELVVLAIDYRLAPEAAFPAAVDDALAAVTWAADHLAELGGTDVLAVGGDSAGGNLSAVVAQALRDRIAAQVLIYPATHMAGDYASRTENAEGYFLDMATMVWFMEQYVGADVDLDDPRHSPFLGDLEGLPPALS